VNDFSILPVNVIGDTSFLPLALLFYSRPSKRGHKSCLIFSLMNNRSFFPFTFFLRCRRKYSGAILSLSPQGAYLRGREKYYKS